jgi:hypothetical protein
VVKILVKVFCNFRRLSNSDVKYREHVKGFNYARIHAVHLIACSIYSFDVKDMGLEGMEKKLYERILKLIERYKKSLECIDEETCLKGAREGLQKFERSFDKKNQTYDLYNVNDDENFKMMEGFMELVGFTRNKSIYEAILGKHPNIDYSFMNIFGGLKEAFTKSLNKIFFNDRGWKEDYRAIASKIQVGLGEEELRRILESIGKFSAEEEGEGNGGE